MDLPPVPSNPKENGVKDILAATVFIITLSTITVLARLYVRLLVIRNTGWDVSLQPLHPHSPHLDLLFTFLPADGD
jgi:hypothetical protein